MTGQGKDRRAHRGRGIVLLLALLACQLASAAGLGFSIEANTSGFFLNPTMTKLWIAKVEAGSAAATAGLLAGDVVLEINGMTVPQSKGRALMSFWKSIPDGTPLRFKVLRGRSPMTIVVPTPKPR